MIEYELLCPFESTMHPEYERARDESTEWVVAHGMVRTPSARSAFERLRIPEFVARAYPDAAYEDLRIVMDWTMWGFLADDQHDLLVEKSELLRARYLEHVEVLENGMTDHVTGMHRALADLRDRILERGGRSCLRRFTHASARWFDSMYTEVSNRAGARPPEILDYLDLRQVSVGMYTEYALFDVTHQVRTTDAFWMEPDIRRLEVMAANIIGWANDIFSYTKERDASDPHNLVLLLGADQGLTDAAAIERTVTLHDREMTRFLEQVGATRESGWLEPGLLEPFLGLLRGWIRGNVDWSMSSARYGISRHSPAAHGSHVPDTPSPSVMQTL